MTPGVDRFDAMPLDWRPGKTGHGHDGYDQEGELVASVSYKDMSAGFPGVRYWSGWLRNTARVPGQYETAEEAMAATDRAWDEGQG
jgi:hypothetical protein